MSKNATRTSSKNVRAEVPRKVSKSPATSVPATTREPRERRSLARQPDSLEGEKIAKKTTTTTSKKPLRTGKSKEREPLSKRTTPSPGAGALRASTTSTRQATTNPPLQSKSKTQAVAKSKPNAVLDTYHSVTVASPPQKRRGLAKQDKESPTPPSKGYSPVAQAKKEHTFPTKKDAPATPSSKEDAPAAPARARTFTRTLDPEEVVVLKRESAKQRSEVEPPLLKQPVAFEVKFEEAKKPDPESDDYSDDFESYESDFETDASTPGEEESEAAEEPSASEAEVEEEEPEEDSEPTQNPITVIQRDKDQERKLDSGHYDMHMRRNPLSSQSTLNHYDSFDTNSMANSEQLDSGISTNGAEKPRSGEANVYYGGYSGFVSHPVISRRGEELMAKLRFDQLNYHLFEMKPLSYEGFMQSYGKLNACQLATQTQSPQMDGECQTLEVHSRSSWTQHPPHYGGQLVLSCSGDAEVDEPLGNQSLDAYEASLSRLEQLRRLEQTRSQQVQQKRLAKTTDLERLNTFLHKAARLMGRVLEGNKHPNQSNGPRNIPLQTGLLNALPVRRIFGSCGDGRLVVTVHECPPESNVYKEDFASLLMVWSLANPGQPLRLLSTWAEVSRVVISGEAQDIVVAGLRDGSVAMWDLRETHSYCSKLDGHLTHFAATQSVVPMLEQQQEVTAMDLGAVVDVRSFRSPFKGGVIAGGLQTAYKEVQYASLNDSGLLTMWTLVEGASSSNSNEFSSPWARVKLLQSATCDLRSYLERRLLKSKQSAYEKTKSLFQGNIYSDDLLRELNETQTLSTALQDQGLQGMRFTSIDTGSELIYVCTNRNFVLCCTRSLKTERFSRIAVNESRFLFPTSLCVLSNESYVAVGLSNGSVMILNCNQRQRQRQKTPHRPKTGLPPASDEPDPETGKSCAIQNIILNERRSFDQQVDPHTNSNPTYDPRPNTALEQIERPRRSYEMRVFDQQLLLSGSGLRQHLVQALILSSDGWRVSALTNGTVRTYDFYRDREVPSEQPTESRSKVTDIAAARSSGQEQVLLILDATGQVQAHTLDY
ncbi:uncharacterized protein LOC108022099 [Drosophila biarmipes]|uniref:uncharacterized protein LOC108022099 n=1 Tax=Drosophila biarmipes TaxID=125945 RepID=UPI0007E7D67E|nr:uncharacterized protein LOC108022099 [Drosophila biarmipes]